MAQDVAPALKAIAEVSARLKAAEAELQKRDASCVSAVAVRSVQGETQVRVLGFNPAAGSPYDLSPREIRMRLRGPQHGELLFSGSSGPVDWNSEPQDEAATPGA